MRVEYHDKLLTPSEVAELFRVDAKTVTRWAVGGRIGSVLTPGGHRRYRESEVRELLEAGALVSDGEPEPDQDPHRENE